MKLQLNQTRKNIIEVLKTTQTPLTLGEISEKVGTEVKTGTTNAMVTAGVIRKVGTKRVPKVTYVEVATYEIGDLSQLETSEN